VIAHAGGIDEIILVVGLLLLFLLFRSSRAKGAAEEPPEGPCSYCGHPLGPETERCPECGFRSRREPVRSSATDGER